jgi:hypothetical protein
MTVVAILATIFTASAQEQKLNLPGTRMSVSSIFQEIRGQAHLGVAYRTDQIDSERMVTLPAQELSLDQIIGLIVAGSDVEGVLDGDVIVFVKKTPAPRIPVPHDGFVPTPLSEFRESLGLRPRSVVLEGEQRMMLSETLVPIEMPMETYQLPVSEYTVNQGMTPRFAVKTNLLYGLGLLTPNLSFEIGLGPKTSLEIGGSYNPWNIKGSVEENQKMVHMIIKPEFRYWLCERFDGHFFGGHLLYGRYVIDNHEVPLLFHKEYKYDGHMFGAGVTYGYSWAFHKRWSAEFAVGAGVMFLKYDRFDCGLCGKDSEKLKKWYFGPTNAAISLVFHIK